MASSSSSSSTRWSSAPTKARTKRKESDYAGDRKQVHLVDLKLVDMVKTGDELEFVYKTVTFNAHISVHGFIATPRCDEHKLTTFQDDTTSYYRMPSNFTNDCVSVFWSRYANYDARTECHTNPSGYERIKHKATAQSLNQLRDLYMTTYVLAAKEEALGSNGGLGGGAPGVAERARLPLDIVDSIVSRAPSRTTTKRRRRTPTSFAKKLLDSGDVGEAEPTSPDYSTLGSIRRAAAEAVAKADAAADELEAREQPKDAGDVGSEVAHMLADGAITIATLRAGGKLRGYKQIAEALQDKLARQSKVMRTLMEFTEKFACESVGAETDAARDAARMIASAIDAAADAEDYYDNDEMARSAVSQDDEQQSDDSGSSAPSTPGSGIWQTTTTTTTGAWASSPPRVRYVAARAPFDLDGLLEQSLAGSYK